MNKLCYLLCALMLLGLAACGSSPKNPLPEVVRPHKDKPTFSVILDDMKEEGTFSTSYYHKYRVVVPDPKLAKDAAKTGKAAVEAQVTGWMEVPEDWYMRNASYLGMTIYSRKDGQVDDQKGPPGYEYVGDPNYGRWRTDSSGNRIWEFFAGYAMMNMLLGNRPIYYNSYRNYQTAGGMGRAYYGGKNAQGRRTYGTAGTVTQRQKPNFYRRSMSRQTAQRSGFSQRVSSRAGRSSVGVRGRSGGFGK